MQNISIVIPTYNRVELLKPCLESVLNQNIENEKFEYEIIVVLDKNDTTTWEWGSSQKTWNCRVKFSRAMQKGVNAARNKGTKEATGDVLYFLDDDCILPRRDWLNSVFKSFDEYKEASAIGGGYIVGKKRDIYALCRNKLDNYYLEFNRRNNNETSVLLGGNSGYRKDVFLKYGGFDERICYGNAETELNDRILKSGERMYFSEELSVFHLPKRQSLFSYLKKSFQQGTGTAYSLIKNGGIRRNMCRRRNKLWFFEITKDSGCGIKIRIAIMIFLLCIAIFYWVGLTIGFIWHRIERIYSIMEGHSFFKISSFIGLIWLLVLSGIFWKNGY
ncbi:MAG: glycosyltransferase [Candidatus Omnitrophica bacterium]|nr:glycosyltransferase [Candidatus Omnitrophota bacterium]